MMKRLALAYLAAFWAFYGVPAFGAGTVPGFSLAQQQDSNGTPLVGCKLYTIQAGTVSTPQSGYQDSALTLPLSNPIICDAYGRLPQIFLADGSIKLRLTKSNGVQVFAADGILVVGASSGGGGGSPVDATTILATGDIKTRHGTGALAGFVRANGRTIGSATSGATERANADCQTLFEYLWNADANLTVSTGRGANAAADWTANKTIALPDARGRAFVGLDGMGNSLAGRLGSGAGSFTVGYDTLGTGGGAEVHSLTLAQLPTGITSVNAAQSITVSTNFGDVVRGSAASAVGGGGVATVTSAVFGAVPSTGSNSISVTSNNTSGAVHDTMAPAILVTHYIKL